MELLLILALIGFAYCVYSDSPLVARLFEVAAVATTLALVAFAQQSHQPLAASLPVAALAAVPVWLACFKLRAMAMAREQKISASTEQLWQEWDSVKNRRREPVVSANESLAKRLQRTAVADQPPLMEHLDSPSLDAMPAAKLSKLNSLSTRAANKAANTASKIVELPTQRPALNSDLELAPMDNCRYKRRL